MKNKKVIVIGPGPDITSSMLAVEQAISIKNPVVIVSVPDQKVKCNHEWSERPVGRSRCKKCGKDFIPGLK